MQEAHLDLHHQVFRGERGAADAERDIRGFAMKSYTEEGNWDLVGNNTPVFFLTRDLYDSIEKRDFPRWKMFIEVMPEKDAAKCPYHPFDLTKVWLRKRRSQAQDPRFNPFSVWNGIRLNGLTRSAWSLREPRAMALLIAPLQSRT